MKDHFMWRVKEISDPGAKRDICREIIVKLPDWFGLAEANESYIEGVGSRDAFAARDESGSPLAMISLTQAYPTNLDIYWLGVRPEYHRQGMGRTLVEAALSRARALGCETMTVETLSDKDPDPSYAQTRQFYIRLGFKPLFELRPTENVNPLVYMMRQI